MAKTFFERLKEYYVQVGEVLRGEAAAASVFPNGSDVGTAREMLFATFLRQHAPSKCNVFLGGFIFDEDGAESKQLDIIVTTDTAPRFDFHNRDGKGKSFSPVEGTLAAVSIKSTLDKKELEDALRGLASIPPTRSLEGRMYASGPIVDYENWPLKVVYASKGVSPETLLKHVKAFYEENPSIPVSRKVDFIYVAGSLHAAKLNGNMSYHDDDGRLVRGKKGDYYFSVEEPDLQAIVWIVHELQQRAVASTRVDFEYGELINGVLRVPKDGDDPVDVGARI